MNWPPLLVVFVSQERNLIITIASAHIALDWRCLIVTRHSYWERRSWSKQDNRICFAREKINYIYVAKARVGMIDVSTLSKNGLPQRHDVGTFDVCLTRPKNHVPLISSVRMWLNLWLTELSITFAFFGLVRISTTWLTHCCERHTSTSGFSKISRS